MKFIWMGCAALSLAGVVLAGCGSAGSPDGTSSDEALSSNASAAPANTIMKVTPPGPSTSIRKPTTSTTAAGQCGPGEKICHFANAKGVCIEECSPDEIACVQPECAVCDPVGTRPNAACQWDTQQCQWDCPVCDPNGPAPEPGCKWDSKACVWLCL